MGKREGNDPTPGELEYVKSLCNNTDPVYCKWMTKRKRDKVQERLIALSKYRIFSIKKTITGKKQVQREAHLFDLRSITCDDSKVVLHFQNFDLDVAGPRATIDFVDAVYKTLQPISYGFPPTAVPKIEGREMTHLDSIDPGTCWGFVATYYAWCDYYKTTPHVGFVNYISEVWTSGSRDLNLALCPGMDTKKEKDGLDLIPVAATLRYNPYFLTFTAKDLNRKDILDCVADFMGYNTVITKIEVSNCRAQDASMYNLADSLKRNTNNVLVDLDFSGNREVKEKGWSNLAIALSGFTHSIHRLNVGSCGMSMKSTTPICQAFIGKEVSKDLIELDLSHNTLGVIGNSQLEKLFVPDSAPKNLQYLLLSDTKLDVLAICKAIKASGITTLVEFDISYNPFLATVALAVGQVVEINPKLNVLDISYCNIQSAQLEPIISSIAKSDCTRVTLKISGNDLGLSGATTVAQSLKTCRNLFFLIAKGCGFKKEGLTKIIESLAHNETLKGIDLSFNFHTGTASKMLKLMEQLANVIVKHPSLEHLNLAGDGSKLCIGKELQPVLTSIGKNPKLLELDVSGNKIGDNLASVFFDNVKVNSRIKYISFDNNNLNISSWLALVGSLENNTSLAGCPKTEIDIERSLKEAKNKDELSPRINEAWERISERIKQNNKGQPYYSEYLTLAKGRTTHILAPLYEEPPQETLQVPPRTGRSNSDGSNEPPEWANARMRPVSMGFQSAPVSPQPSPYSITITLAAPPGVTQPPQYNTLGYNFSHQYANQNQSFYPPEQYQPQDYSQQGYQQQYQQPPDYYQSQQPYQGQPAYQQQQQQQPNIRVNNQNYRYSTYN